LSISIKIGDVKHDNQFGGRTTNISLGSNSFKTPNRTATNKEYNVSGDLPHDIKINNPVSEYILEFNTSNIQNFLNGNGSFANRIEKLENGTQIMREYPVLSTIKTPNNMRMPIKSLKLFLELQNLTDISIISLPPFEYSNIDEFSKVIIDYNEMASQRKQEIMPIIHMETKPDVFKEEFKALRELYNNDACKLIGFKYAHWKTHVQQLNEIHQHRDENIWYHCFDVPRKPRGQSNDFSAHLHSLQNWGVDTVSPYTIAMTQKQVAYLIYKNSQVTPDNLNMGTRFDADNLGILSESQWTDNYHENLNCNCEICRGTTLSEFKEKYSEERNGNFNPSVLTGAVKIHELLSGTDEFKKSYKEIKSDNLHNYYDKKSFIRGKIPRP